MTFTVIIVTTFGSSPTFASVKAKITNLLNPTLINLTSLNAEANITPKAAATSFFPWFQDGIPGHPAS